MSQAWIDLTILVNVRCYHPRTRAVIQVEYGALADVEVEAYSSLTPTAKISNVPAEENTCMSRCSERGALWRLQQSTTYFLICC